MTERAQALEAAVRALIEPMCERVTDNGIVRQKMLVVAGDDAFDRYRRVVELLAVQPPPPVGSPTTERDQLREALAAIQQSTRDDEKGEQWTIRNFLNKHGVFNDDISGSRRLVAEACRYVLSTPVEPAGASEPPKKWIPTEGCTCYLCRAARLSPAPVSPVAPEPPTETRSELREVREQLAALAHEQWAGWMAHVFRKCEQREGGWWMPAEWADRWLRQIATPYLFLTPSEQDSDRKEAERVLGVMLTVAPTGAPAPCVWRDIASAPKDGTRVLVAWQYWSEQPFVAYFKHGRWNGEVALSEGDTDGPTHWTPLPTLPLTVER